MRRHPAPRPRGAAALLVVMVLFFILALAAAYASRNLVFEQRISSNNYRATQAQEAAEAGIEWAVGLLSQGRVDNACTATNNPAATTFRERHLTQDADGWFSLTALQSNLRPSCVMGDAGWQCSCPGAAAPALPVPDRPTPNFQLRFVRDASVDRPGVIRLESRGCSSVGAPCYAGAGVRAEAESWSTVLLAVSPALASPPQAALTARGRLDLKDSAVRVVNADIASNGITVMAGGELRNTDGLQLSSAPGSPSAASVLTNDAALQALDASRMFVSVFGTDRASYRRQPAAVRVPCNSGCAGALSDAAAANPGRPLWVEGDATIDSPLALGTDAQPVMLVVEGRLTANAALSLNGMLYLRGDQLDAAVPVQLRGALAAEGDLTIEGPLSVAYDAALLRQLHLNQGSMVRVPGSWRDFATN